MGLNSTSTNGASSPAPPNRLRKLAKLLDAEIRRKNVEALHVELRERWYDLVHPFMPDPVFVVGCSRSGTTITFETLARSAAFVSFGYELPQFWNSLVGPLNNGWRSEAADASDAKSAHRHAALRHFYSRLGAGQVLDKTCINVMRIPYLLRLFPRARFVYIQRDGRDNISSLIDGWRHDGHFEMDLYLGKPPVPVAIDGGTYKQWAFFYPPDWQAWNHASLAEVCAYQWMTANRLALQARSLVPPAQWVHLRYEDIFDEPGRMFRRAFEQLGVAFTDELERSCAELQPTSVVSGAPRRGKWKGRNRAEVERVLPMIRPLMRELGYQAD